MTPDGTRNTGARAAGGAGGAAPETLVAALRRWRPPEDRPVLTVIDAHAAGEPLRVVTGGWPPVPGTTMSAKRGYARTSTTCGGRWSSSRGAMPTCTGPCSPSP